MAERLRLRLEWWCVSLKFVPRDLWIGVYIGEREPRSAAWWRTVYVCLLPMVVLSFAVRVERVGVLAGEDDGQKPPQREGDYL